MPDEGFEHPRLVALYDAFEGDRVDLAAYLDIVEELGGRSVLDLGCETGTFAVLLAARGIEVTMTGNVAQAIVDEPDWAATLRGAYAALRPGGYLVFETRNPAFRAWQDWNRDSSYRVTDIPGVGTVQTWVDLTGIDGPLVSFRRTWIFASDGQRLTSDSTLRFRERDEVEQALLAHGYTVDDVRDAPDRPGREFVFLARRPR